MNHKMSYTSEVSLNANYKENIKSIGICTFYLNWPLYNQIINKAKIEQLKTTTFWGKYQI